MAATFISTLDPTVVERVQATGVPRVYKPRSYIFHEGDPGSGVFVVESGLLRVDRTTRGGKVVLLNLQYRGSLIGELAVLDNSNRSASLSTVTESVVRFVAARDFRALMQSDPAIQSAVIGRLIRRLRALSNQFLETSTMDAPARIASRLLELVEIERTLGRLDHSRSQIDLPLPISQAELGQWSGLGREGAVKGLRTLRSIGLIETSRMRVLIRDVDALRTLVDRD